MVTTLYNWVAIFKNRKYPYSKKNKLPIYFSTVPVFHFGENKRTTEGGKTETREKLYWKKLRQMTVYLGKRDSREKKSKPKSPYYTIKLNKLGRIKHEKEQRETIMFILIIKYDLMMIERVHRKYNILKLPRNNCYSETINK